jgi:glucose dehydrogenase
MPSSVHKAATLVSDLPIAAMANRIFALDAKSGELLWQRDEISDTESDVAVADGMLYASDCPTMKARGIRMLEDCRLIGLNPHTGNVLWHQDGIGRVRLLASEHVL